MSLPTATAPRVNTNTSANAEIPPPATAPAPDLAGERDAGSSANKIGMASRKRPRDDKDAMQVGGVDSAEGSDEGSNDSSVDGSAEGQDVDEVSSEPVVKRRRIGAGRDNGAALRAAREQLSEALQQGDLQQLEALLNQHPGCLEFKHPATKATPLLEAAWWGQVEAVRWLLRRGADPSAECGGYYAVDLTEDELPAALRMHASTQLMASPGSKESKGLCGKWEGHVLWHSPLAHAAGHRAHAVLQLLLDHGGKPTAAALSAALAGRDDVGVQALLAAGASPDHGPASGPYQNASCFALAVCIDWGWEVLLEHMVKTLSAEDLVNELRGMLAYCIEEIELPLLQRLLDAGVTQYPQVVQGRRGRERRDGPRKDWLVKQALRKGNGSVACWLLRQGYAYAFENEADVRLAAQGCREALCFVDLQQRMPTPLLKERLLNWCLYKNLLLYYEGNAHNKPSEEFKCWLVAQGAWPFFAAGADADVDVMHREYAFHLAVNTDNTEVVRAFLNRYPNQDFHVPGVAEIYPIELAAMRREPLMVQLLMSRIVPDQHFFCGLYEHAVTRVRCMHLGTSMFSGQMVKVPDTARSAVFMKVCDALDWKSLEFMFTYDSAHLVDWFLNMKLAFPEAKRAQLDSFVRQADLLHRPARALDTPAWKASVHGGWVLEQIGLEARKGSAAFGKGVAKRLDPCGLAGEIGATLQLLWEGYSYLRAAIIDVDRDAAVAGQQFASFVGHWLPATPVWESWLKASMEKADDKDVSMALRYALTHRIVAQVKDLREGGKARVIAWATQLYAQLPLLCVSCVDAETERVDFEKAAQALQRLGVFRPNAKRLAFALQCAYAKVVASTAASSSSSGIAGTPAQLYRGFAEQLLAEIRKIFAASDDNDVSATKAATEMAGLAQREVADALSSLSQDNYQRQHGGGKTLTPEFLLDATHLLSELAWWQMDALLKNFGLALDGQANLLDREMKPFERFAQALPQHAKFLEAVRFEY